MRYRTRVKYITAIQFTPETVDAVKELLGDLWQGFLQEPGENGKITTAYLKGWETITINGGDWLTRDAAGELVIMTNDNFISKYVTKEEPFPEDGEDDLEPTPEPVEPPAEDENTVPPIVEPEEPTEEETPDTPTEEGSE